MTGYITDAHYADTCFRELSPAWLNYVAALHGVVGPPLDKAFTYLELGCGFGHSTVVHAGAFPHAEFHACDFNPAHVAGGRTYAEESGIRNIRFLEASFEQLRQEPDLPAFDFIVLHGVYGWVDGTSRHAIHEIIRGWLKPGGLLYVSYNCLPGWATEVPLRRLLKELADGSEGDTDARTTRARDLLSDLHHAPLRFFKAHPDAFDAVESYTKGSSQYLAHEFLNDTWEPFYSIDVADAMAACGAVYVGSATLADNHPVLVIDDRSAAACGALPTPRQRQLALDFAANRRFRRDVFVRAGNGSPPRQPAGPDLERLKFGAIADPQALNVKARVPRGEVRFQEAFVADLRPLLAQGSMTIAEAVDALAGARTSRDEIARNVMLLVAAGTLVPVAHVSRPDLSGPPRRVPTPLASRVLDRIAAVQAGRVMPSEVLGYGLPVSVDDARQIREWLGGADVQPPLVSALRRLAIVS